ncbi:MAG: EamA family transporter RarD [Litoreibacter sp.]|uniref:EamA family transporter RarD n=1 Tax=Litoreibacter sp. TaxID=1969459 RepID=UPI003297D5D3
MAHSDDSTDKSGDSPVGFAFAISAYFLWGFLPLYMKALSHVPAAEIVAHRVIWSIPIAGLVLIFLRRTNDIKVALTTPKMLAMGCVTAVLISLNWGIYVWAISAGHTLDAALGYYINPLLSVFLGFALLKEKLTRLQWAAIALAVAAVVVLTIDAGRLPLVSIAVSLTWGFYALFKKALPIGPNQGFLLEVLILAIPAIGYLIYIGSNGISHFSGNVWLLVGCGVVTAVPLMLFANGAKRLRMTTTGILQYIAPTLIFLVAVFVFGEPFGTAHAIAFPMIWAALILYTYSMVRSRGQ